MVIGGFNVIISMDWLSPNHVKVLWFEKPLHLPLSNRKSLIIYEDKPSKNLRIISYMKSRKYLQKKYYAFLAHIVNKKDDMRKIKKVPHVRDYPDVFLEDLPELPQCVMSNFG